MDEDGPTGRRKPRPRVLRLLAAIVAAAALCSADPAAGQRVETPTPPPAIAEEPVVGGVGLETTIVAGRPVHHDREVPPEVVALVGATLGQALADVPRLTDLPPIETQLAVHLLSDQARFRLALAELGGVRIDLVAPDVGGYTIERGGTMLVFFPYRSVATPSDATYALVHELVHLAEREATARRPFPQWFNEGYAEWISRAALRDRFPEAASVVGAGDRAVVASTLLSRGALIPWADLVTRVRFSRAGVEGLAAAAYAQSTLFVDWLAQLHGRDALARFLLAIGQGASPTRAFEWVLGPFAPQAEAFAAAVAELPTEFGPGLHRLTSRGRAGEADYLAIVGGAPGERVTVEIHSPDAPTVTFERTLNAVGFAFLGLSRELTAQPGWRLIRVDSPSLGLLELALAIEPLDGPIPAPVQIPRSSAQRQARMLALAG